MIVITTQMEDHVYGSARKDNKCSLCSDKAQFPYLNYGDNLTICGSCALKHQRGLTADLIQLAAIVELRKLGYHEFTCKRERIKSVDQRMKEELGAPTLRSVKA